MVQPGVEEVAHVLREFVTTTVRTTPSSRLSRTAASALSFLHRNGPQRVTTLAARESITQPAMTGLIKRLEDAGLVARAPDPFDGRATLIAITDAGTVALCSRRREHDRILAERIEALDPDELSGLLAAVPALKTLSESS